MEAALETETEEEPNVREWAAWRELTAWGMTDEVAAVRISSA
jgi:hypothetical protein